MNTKLFLDCEFTGLHKNTTLISLALISEYNDIFYAEFTDYDLTQLDSWLNDNVIKNLSFNEYKTYNLKQFKNNKLNHQYIKNNTNVIQKHLKIWLTSIFHMYSNNIEIWGDCLAYDWVLFINLFGDAFNLPKFIYYIPFDLSTIFKLKGINPDINREEFSFYECTELDKKHSALTDARVIKGCYEKLLFLTRMN